MYKFRSLEKATDNKHKYVVILDNLKTGRTKTIKFGAYGLSDFTQHKDEDRKMRYKQRHEKRENWNDPGTAGFWSLHLLWNKPTLKASLSDTIKKFNL